MKNLTERINEVFIDVLDLSPNFSPLDISMDKMGEWDSVKNISLIAALEEEFGIKFSFEEMMEINSYNKTMEIISSKLKE